METLLQDLRFAVRMQLRTPGFLLVVVLTLGLGIGATAAIFTVVNSVVLRPLPYPQPERVVEVYEQNLARGWEWFSVSPTNYADWRDQNEVFEHIAAFSSYRKIGFNLTGDGRPERVVSAGVTPGFFPIFGLQPLLGRTFSTEEDVPGNDHVVVLTFGLWQRRFGGDPQIVGRSIELDGVAYQVVGVMPKALRYPDKVDLWVPLALTPEEWQSRTVRSLQVRARLKPGVSLAQAQAQMSAIASRLERDYPASNTGFGVILYPMHDRVVGGVRPLLFLLLGGVLFVLLIACANVANLLLARGAVRQRELGLRLALGASHGRLGRQLITESLLLGLLGGALGLLLAVSGVRLLVAAAPAFMPRLEEIRVDGSVLLFTLVVSLVTGVLFGLAPAWQVKRTNLAEVVGEGGRSGTGGRSRALLRQLLVITEVALALALLICAGLMGRSFLRLQQVDPGFRPGSVLTMELPLPTTKYATQPQQLAFYRELLERVDHLPGVSSAAVINRLPLTSVAFMWDFFKEGSPPKSLDEVLATEYRTITPKYFDVMGIPLLEGRAFTEQDREDSPGVVIINEQMRRQFWGDGPVLGQRIQLGTLIAEQYANLPLMAEVVGVVGNVHQFQLSVPATPQVYMPASQYPFESVFLVARTAGKPEASTPLVLSEIQNIDPQVPVYDVRPMERRVADSVSGPRLAMTLFGVFSAVALFLAAVGIYGVMSYSVNQRVQEIGIRVALGADSRRILGLVVGQAMRLVLLGLAAGLVLGLGLSFLMRSLLFGISGQDPLTFVVTACALALVGALASAWPARRASRVDPMIALRSE